MHHIFIPFAHFHHFAFLPCGQISAMGKNPLKWQPGLTIAVVKICGFCKMNEWNQVARRLLWGHSPKDE